ncbi:MAG: hypothetical protein WC130_11740 [Kiritimatiellia bacterium]
MSDLAGDFIRERAKHRRKSRLVIYRFEGYHPELRNCPELIANALHANNIMSASAVFVNRRKATPEVLCRVNSILRRYRKAERMEKKP